MKQNRTHRQSISKPLASLQPLEPRRLMSATTIGIYGSINGSETNPNTTGRGEFIFKRPTGSTLHSMTLGYYVRSTSTTNTSDYQTLTGTVTIPRDKRSVAINVFPNDDLSVEGTETLTLVLRNRSDATNIHSSAFITISDNDTNTTGWLGGTRRYRTSLTYNPGSTARTAQPFEDDGLNFTSVLTNQNTSGTFSDSSLKVVEVDSAGNQIDSAVAFQFDHATTGYNASSNATGNLVIQATGTTAANATRRYQVYFDTTSGHSYSAPTFTPLVSTTDNATDLTGDTSSIKVVTSSATYYYQKDTGGFSSILDTDGVDWVSWNSTPGSIGEFRGVPNLGDSGFHPGRTPAAADGVSGDAMNTTVVSSGPLKTVVDSKTTVTGNEVRWTFYPTYASMSVITMDRNYYFLYEATPGGGSSTNGQTITNADVLYSSTGSQPLNTSNNQPITATSTATDETSDTNFNTAGNEFAYIENTTSNGGAGRYFYMAHNNADNIPDSYFDLDGNMTVLGFGRQNTAGNNRNVLMSGQNTFTIGLANGGGNFAAASAHILGTYKDVTVSAGSSDTIPS